MINSAWIQTYKGLKVCPFDMKPEMIDIEDISHALSNQCRFSGHCKYFYSVAEHSVIVAALVKALAKKQGSTAPNEIAMNGAILYGLLHDAAEAYLVDIPRPMKPHLPEYVHAEDRAMAVILKKFNLEHMMWASPLIKEADDRALAIEAKYLMGDTSEWQITRYEDDLGVPDPVFLSSQASEKLFFQTFMALTRKRIPDAK